MPGHLQTSLERHLPPWFRGALSNGYARFAGLPALEDFVARSAHLRGLAFVEAALDFLGARYLVDHVEREHIPEQGRVVIVANHPMGGIDALLLLACVGQIRRDVKIVANAWLQMLPGLADLLVPVPTLDGRAASAEQLRAALSVLENDGALILFPAAEVSRLGLRGIRDRAWRKGFVGLAERAKAPVVPVRVQGRNSALFYGASALFSPLGTALLPRELRSRRGARVVLRVGAPREVSEFAQADRVRTSRVVEQATRALGSARDAWRPKLAPIVHRPRLREVARDLDALPLLGETPDGKRIHAGRLASDSPLLREIGRLRESTFRAVGEGTGQRLDLDRFDTWYDHIVLWDAAAGEIAGAYRAVRCAQALAERGPDALYTRTLFDFDRRLDDTVAQGAELGRSFVARAYWGTRSLDYLWCGIGAWLRRQPDVRYLFGPVSISAALPLDARELIVGYYRRFYGESTALATATRPFRFSGAEPDFGELDADAAMRVLRTRLQALGARVPTLYKQYAELCEPGGVDFLAFGVDPDFADSVDGLVRVDLTRLKPTRIQRYLAPG